MNVHTIAGRLTRDPEMVGAEGSVAKFTIAVDEYDFSAKEKVTEYFDCAAFGKQAENVERYYKKGTFVIASGRMRSRVYESKKNPGVEVKAWTLNIDRIELGPKSASSSSSATDEDVETAPSTVKLW